MTSYDLRTAMHVGFGVAIAVATISGFRLAHKLATSNLSFRDALKMISLVHKGPYKSLFSYPPMKEQMVLEAVLGGATQGDPASVIAAIDKFAYQHWMMNLGDVKGETLDSEIESRRPAIMLELGAYCGYSAVRSGRLLPTDSLLVSVEFNALCCAIASKVVDHAGLSQRVRVLWGNVERVLPQLRTILASRGKDKFDLIFIDHEKTQYLPDLRLLEDAGLIGRGTVVVADNVIVPGAPDFLEYVRHAAHYRTRFVTGHIEYQTDVKDGIEICECVTDPHSKE